MEVLDRRTCRLYCQEKFQKDRSIEYVVSFYKRKIREYRRYLLYEKTAFKSYFMNGDNFHYRNCIAKSE